jgi:hypothetical protein
MKYDIKVLNIFPKGVWPTTDVINEYRGLEREDAIKLDKRLRDQGLKVIVTELKVVTF